MKPLPSTPELLNLARRVVWFTLWSAGLATLLAVPFGLTLPVSFTPAVGSYVWFGPALTAAYVLVRRSSSRTSLRDHEAR